MSTTTRPGRTLTIAGSDSGGGAGIQADLKTFSALGTYGMSAITAITAQNTLGVTAVLEMPTDLIAAQIDAVVTDIGVDAAKTGMLSSAAIIRTVAERVQAHQISKLVVDPVMVATSGDRLLREDAVSALTSQLLPLALIVTPNLPEAEVLTGLQVRTLADMHRAAERIVALGARSALVKGGHTAGDAIDVYFSPTESFELKAPRVETTSTHGTGCTLAAAIAAGLARGETLPDAVRAAKQYLTAALQAAYPLGHGHGPVHHFHAWWP
ncbi:MAG: bifunctional hydroxymethylpyrimidine kinase/phosphomethylpyrimidine kinase [Chloroflexota bacterium]